MNPPIGAGYAAGLHINQMYFWPLSRLRKNLVKAMEAVVITK